MTLAPPWSQSHLVEETAGWSCALYLSAHVELEYAACNLWQLCKQCRTQQAGGGDGLSWPSSPCPKPIRHPHCRRRKSQPDSPGTSQQPSQSPDSRFLDLWQGQGREARTLVSFCSPLSASNLLASEERRNKRRRISRGASPGQGKTAGTTARAATQVGGIG